MPKLHALLIGVGKYKNSKITELKGCNADLKKFECFVGRCNPSIYDIEITKLLDDEATKEAIVEAICECLKNTNDGDMFLLYFTGHGCQEKSDDVWKRLDNNRDLECLVCHDLDFQGNGCLADKEIRFLFNKFLKNKSVEVVTLFDSCHSGDATRGDLIAKRLDEPIKKRAWHQFEFGVDLPIKLFQSNENSLDELLPLVNHIHFAACRDEELAYQSSSGSIFTNVLIQVVEQSDGEITYNDLQSRILSFVSNKYTQTPNIEAIGEKQDDLNKIFLKGGIVGRRQLYNLTFSTQEGNWQLEIGRIMGLSSKDNKQLVIMLPNGKVVGKGIITEVLLCNTIIELDSNTILDTQKAYQVELAGLFKVSTNFYLQGSDWGVTELKKYLEESKSELSKFNIVEVSDIALADISIFALREVDKNGISQKGYFITPPFIYTESTKITSFANEISGFGEESAQKVLNNLKKIAHWKYVNGINNQSSLQRQLNVLLKKDNGDILNFKNETPLSLVNGEKILFEIENLSEDVVYINCFLLTQSFGVIKLIDNANAVFEPHQKKNAPRDKYLNVKSHFPNLPFESLWVKFIFANEKITLPNLEQEGLLTEPTKSTKGKEEEKMRGSDFSIIDESWATLTYELRAKVTPTNL